MNSLTHSTNVYQLLIKRQSPFQAMGYTGVTKSGRNSYRKLEKNKSFLENEVSQDPSPQVAVPSGTPCLPKLSVKHTQCKIFQSSEHHLEIQLQDTQGELPQTQQDLESSTLEFLHPQHLGFRPPISTHHFSQGPATSGLETVQLSIAAPSDLTGAKNNHAH